MEIFLIYMAKTQANRSPLINIIRIRIGAIGKNKLVGPDRVSGEILKLRGGRGGIHDSVPFATTRRNNE
jgi:hypothetical protein